MSMQSLLAASQSIARMQTMQSVRTQIQGTANVLRTESKLDGGNGKKLAQAEALEGKSNDLMEGLMDEVKDVNEILKPNEDAKTEEASGEEATAKKPPKTDTLELSDSASRHIGGESHENLVLPEAVTYQADGSTNPSKPDKNEPTFRTTA